MFLAWFYPTEREYQTAPALSFEDFQKLCVQPQQPRAPRHLFHCCRVIASRAHSALKFALGHITGEDKGRRGRGVAGNCNFRTIAPFNFSPRTKGKRY